MRFLANENVPLASVRLLRAAGHDVVAVAEIIPGAPDDEVLRHAARDGLVVITFDGDYGELIYRLRRATPAGVVYLRFAPRPCPVPSLSVVSSLWAGSQCLTVTAFDSARCLDRNARGRRCRPRAIRPTSDSAPASGHR